MDNEYFALQVYSVLAVAALIPLAVIACIGYIVWHFISRAW